MKRTFTKYPQGYVKADGMSIASPDEWADNNYSADELSDEELQAIQRRTANRRASYEHNRPLWKGRKKASFADPVGSPRIESRGNIAASNKLRKFTRYSKGYVRASGDNRYHFYIDNYNKFSGYVDNDNDILSLTDLGFIYDTLVSDDDPVACRYDSFDSWLDSLIDSGALSGCWMSDAQRSDMPYEFGGYEPEWGEYDDDDDYYDDNI